MRKEFTMQYYLAIDIGASGGRHILASKECGKIILEEVYRFENSMDSDGGKLYWDIERLFQEIKTGMKKCAELGKIPTSLGIDTWGVDYVLIGKEGQKLGNPIAYRDHRTEGMDKEVYKYISEEELYKRTGIQKQLFNTIYQLMALKVQEPELLIKAERMLLIPDYLHYLLTGVMATEYTNATTTQLVSPTTKDWDWDLIRKLGYPDKIFAEILQAGTVLGNLTPDMEAQIGYSCKVVLPATHDTGSAVMAVPTNQENTIYISSGTWSLMGTELLEANCSDKSKLHNFTNEGGYNYRFRYLKNIMGLWMIQSVKKEIGQNLNFGEICALASISSIESIVDCNDNRFLAPQSMTEEVQQACMETNQQIPQGIADVAAVIYNSLAKCYGGAIKDIEETTGNIFDSIHIVGGGSNAEYLNRLTAKETGKTVYAGPTEATAIGNICSQMIANNDLKDLTDARNCIYESFPIKTFKCESV